MSLNIYQSAIDKNPLTTNFGAYLVSSAYTYSFLHTTLDEIATLGNPVFLSKIGSTVSGTITFHPADPIFSNIASGSVNAMIVYDTNDSSPLYYIPTDLIVMNNADISIEINTDNGLINITKRIKTYSWTLEKYYAKAGNDVNPEHSKKTLDQLKGNYNHSLGICSFSKVSNGKIIGMNPNPIEYDKLFEADPDYNDINIAHSKRVAEHFNQSGGLFACSFSVVDTGKIGITHRLPNVNITEATYSFALVQVPQIEVTRYNDNQNLRVFIPEEKQPDPIYVMIIYTGDDYRNQLALNSGWTNDPDSFNQIKTGFDTNKNYKVAAAYTVAGNINGSPVTVEGRKSPRRTPNAQKQKL